MDTRRKKRINKNLEKIAKKEGVTPDQVREDITRAISYAMKDPDPNVQNFWKTIPCEGDSPTVEEVIDFLSSRIAKDQ